MSPPSRSSSVNLSAQHSVVHLSRHTLKQLKFVLPGGVATYLLGTVAKLGQLLENESRWARYSRSSISCHYLKYQYYTARIYAKSSLFCGIITIGLFLYILLVPWLKGTRPNVWPSLLFHFTLMSHIWAHVPSLQYSKWRQSGELSTVVPVRIVFNATQIAYILNISSIIYPDINRPHGPWMAPFILYSQPLDRSRSHKRSDSL